MKKAAGRTGTRRRAPAKKLYRALFNAWGPQRWWPGRTRLEVIVGAVLTQNTAWGNVEKAIGRLRRADALSLPRLHALPLRQLEGLIRPAGYFRVKARRLRALTTMIVDRHGALPALFRLSTPDLRDELLRVNGVGPETADSILLYAAGRPAFVVDAYTRRFMTRHGWLAPKATYDETARALAGGLPRNVRLYNEFHALIVRLGKDCCRPRPLCGGCPLAPWLPRGGPRP
ncbi:MAG TPA: endonuclease III domain-containing protein [Kiritimatiellia bacterium]|nr:endonuclease III domain-containing protein [Kiritimatiellia bacterium]HRZ10845.1 endonuclease III domain-containing protein [Kiritimatiellia bacterium]HSA18882.1 endonuclease III domain-containing protein [Kiritimatiellia bacterium]